MGRVETHKRIVHGIITEDSNLCGYCGKTFLSEKSMNYHLAKVHDIGNLEPVSI